MKAKPPQKETFRIVQSIDKFYIGLIWIVFFLSLIDPVVGYYKLKPIGLAEKAINSFDYLIPIFIVIIFILFIIRNFILIPKAEKERRADFIDNSFGSKLSLYNSAEYYTNQEITVGVEKFGANLFQNIFFTTNISKKMRRFSIIKSSIVSLLLFLLAVYGFKNSPISIPILQLFLSVNVIGGLIRLLLYVDRNEQLLQQLQNYYDTRVENFPLLFKIYSEYESNLAWSTIVLDEKTFKKYNLEIEKKWQVNKSKYSIK